MIIFTMVVNDDIDVDDDGDDGDDDQIMLQVKSEWKAAAQQQFSRCFFIVLFISLSINQTSSSSKLIILI